ncbi:hypothetical protein AHF37_10068 [Paragonimus kellicotti]|nr:hypothetical protein AHF37_10068 [Paragonimus kellicotti]
MSLVFGFLFLVRLPSLVLCLMCLWSMDGATEPISGVMELPLLGSFLLIGSSITATTYHHCRGLEFSWVFLALQLGSGVVLSFLYVADSEMSFRSHRIQSLSGNHWHSHLHVHRPETTRRSQTSYQPAEAQPAPTQYQQTYAISAVDMTLAPAHTALQT